MSEVLNQEPLLRALHEAGVEHIIIGGFAVNAHGVIRPSKTSTSCRVLTQRTWSASPRC